MIFKKPYAILIKHFKKINFVIFLMIGFLLYQTFNFTTFIREYISLGIYNPSIQSVNSYISPMFFISVFIIILFSLFMLVLLFYKKRPHLLYISTIITYIYLIIAFMFGANYFNTLGQSTINLRAIYLVRDLLNIALVPQVILIFNLFIRSIGLDLKKFGFNEDKEFLDISNEDNEEFEVAVEIDKDVLLRKIKTRLRFFKYFYFENKYLIWIGTFLLVCGISFTIYYQITVVNRVYQINESFAANSYMLKIKNVFQTDKDYKDQVIDDGSRSYVIINFEVENTSTVPVVMNTTRFMLINQDKTFVPNMRLAEKFQDLGEFYKEQTLSPNQKSSYNLLFEVDSEFVKTNYALYYLESTNVNQTYLRKIKLTVNDLSDSNLVDTKKLGENIDLLMPNNDSKSFSFSDFSVNNEIKYYYEECRDNNCIMKSKTVNSSQFAGRNTLMMLTFNSNNLTNEKLNDILVNYGKIIYRIDDTVYEEYVKKVVSRNFRGNVVYLVVPELVKEAKNIEFKITLRTRTYTYILRENQNGG